MKSALFFAALLTRERGMDQFVQRSVIWSVSSFDGDSRDDAIRVLADAFSRYGVPRDPSGICTPRRFRYAALTAGRWQAEKVTVIEGKKVCLRDAAGLEIPPAVFARGDPSILSLGRLAILSSRGPRRIAMDAPWLMAIKDQFRFAIEDAEVVVSSLGAPGYDIVSCMAARRGIPLVVVCNGVLPFMQSAERCAEFFAYHEGMFRPETTLFLSPFVPGPAPPVEERSAERDRLVAASASFIAAAAIRERGNMHAILASAAEAGVPVTVFDPEGLDNRFNGNRSLVEHSSRIRIHRPHRNGTETEARIPVARAPAIHSSAGRVLSLGNWPGEGYWLTHYTRSCAGPWPGQSHANYYGALIEARENAGHTGFDTLRRILDEGLFRAGDRFTRGRIPVVSFTECLPGELADLVEWRRGLIRWSFEPYAVAVKKDTLVNLGAGPVIYGEEDLFDELSEDQRFLFQLQRSGGKTWAAEKEWRVLGDIKLETLPREDVTVIVPTLDEAWIIQDFYHFQVTLAGIDWKGSTDAMAKKTRD